MDNNQVTSLQLFPRRRLQVGLVGARLGKRRSEPLRASLFHAETIRGGVCFIGRMLDLDDDFLLIQTTGTHRNIDPGEMLLASAQVTRVDAGGQYERRLVEHVRHRAEEQGIQPEGSQPTRD